MPKKKRKDSAQLRKTWARARRAETQFGTALRSLARRCGELAKQMYDADDPEKSAKKLQYLLQKYSDTIKPWADTVAERMVLDVTRRDEAIWFERSKQMAYALRKEIKDAPVGEILRTRIREAASLITSLPLDASIRVGELTIKALTTAVRPEEISEEILKTGQVSKSRADLIARTEVARTASELVRARAEYVGSDGYIWRTSEDADVRPRHRKLNGKFFKWGEPPVAGERGERAHAGQIYNCFPGETLVSLANGCRRIFRASFNGDLITFVAGDVQFAVTPQHPILTTRGWLAAQTVQPGDYLIQVMCYPQGVVEQDKNNAVSFEQVFRALSLCGESETLTSLEANLYGDVLHEEVDVVSVDELLPGDIITEKFQRICNFAFTETNSRIIRSVVRGNDKVCMVRHSGFGDSFPSGMDRGILGLDDIGFGTVASNDIITFENIANRQPIGLILSRERKLALAFDIGLDNIALRQVCSSVMSGASSPLYYDPTSTQILAEIVSIDRECGSGFFQHKSRFYKPLRVVEKFGRKYSGHVFTMESGIGWYTVANGVISGNCRCWPEPVLPE